MLRAVFLGLLAIAVVEGRTFAALDTQNPVCTYGIDKIRIKGATDKSTPKFLKKYKSCKGSQGYAIKDCQKKSCQCRRFHTYIDKKLEVTTWAECLPKIKEKTKCIGPDLRFCENLLRGKDPLSGGGGKAADGKKSPGSGVNRAPGTRSGLRRSAPANRASGNVSTTTNVGGTPTLGKNDPFPVLPVVLASVGVILVVAVGTWLVVSKKKPTKPANSADIADPQSLDFDDFDDDDHKHKDIYSDAQSTSAAIHTVAGPPRRMSSSSVSSVSSSDDDDDEDNEHEDHHDSWTEYSKK